MLRYSGFSEHLLSNPNDSTSAFTTPEEVDPFINCKKPGQREILLTGVRNPLEVDNDNSNPSLSPISPSRELQNIVFTLDQYGARVITRGRYFYAGLGVEISVGRNRNNSGRERYSVVHYVLPPQPSNSVINSATSPNSEPPSSKKISVIEFAPFPLVPSISSFAKAKTASVSFHTHTGLPAPKPRQGYQTSTFMNHLVGKIKEKLITGQDIKTAQNLGLQWLLGDLQCETPESLIAKIRNEQLQVFLGDKKLTLKDFSQ